jgi:pyruvate formate lyase activating enzyme
MTAKDFNNTVLKRNIVSVTRMTTHNGPGIRSLILFKGCPLRCLWCSTPESQKVWPELAFFADKCIHCSQCLPVCVNNAIRLSEKTLIVDQNLCDNCGRCAEVCTAKALKIIGHPVTVEELVEEVRKDELFFRKSRGGVTISGGEPLSDLEFNLKLLPRFREEGISVGVDTCGHVSWGDIEPLLPYIDFFLWDIKHMNPEKHRALTGVSNRLILHNAQLIARRNIPLYIRIPVIPDHNDTEENLKKTCEFARNISSVIEIGLLPLHHLGSARYASLRREYPIDGIPLIADSRIQEIKTLVESYGLKCSVVG